MPVPIRTKFTSLFNVSSPIVSAPMAYATSPALVAAVINGGGVGFLAAGLEPAVKLGEAIDQARAAISDDKKHLVSMGFISWVLDKFDSENDQRLQTVLDKEVYAVWFAYGTDLGKHIARVRAYDATRNHKTLVCMTANTTEEAVRAANEWKPDLIVMQGSEAGGRGSTYSPPIQELLQAAVHAIPEDGPIVLAAGGVVRGEQVAKLLTLGASGVVIGTRFLFTNECAWTDEMKSVIIEAGAESTERSPAYDVIFPPGVWPDGIQARCVKNEVLRDFEYGLSEEERKQNIQNGRKDHLLVYAGIGVAEMSEVQSASDVFRSLHEETVTTLSDGGSHLLD
ncbi:inosine monophosphate dehydrogenase [Wolfiporia cocos MD-104 SS10]|uniref:Inosine monophosphate dehydrogenase n=1 Tax=Wolfiporia cocos (strain MD-104) TaxID=742152 RepID=A0A2H3J745_WOLCO|nr:inosine monophosphate dehydrogenase [Wolfiporia cocos MD-104 SS10]